MNEIQTKIKEFGDQKNLIALNEYVNGLDVDELISFINEHVLLRNGMLTWNYLLQSFNDSPESHNKRHAISTAILSLIDNRDVPAAHSSAIVTRLLLELPKFKSDHLIELCDYCIAKIQRGNVFHTNWKDLLPDILSILMGKDYVVYNSKEIAGNEYKTLLINSLCMINWSVNIVIPLTAMFRDIALTKEEHLQVVTKLGCCMEKMTCAEVPAFTYQLLKLCATQNSRSIFLWLQYYFAGRVYKNLGKHLDAGSESTDLDDIADASEHDALQAESTVLYHIHNSAALDHGSIKEYMQFYKNMCKAPEFVLHPFQLTVLMTISTVSIFEEHVSEIVRSCMVRLISEDLKKTESSWFNDMAIPKIEISNIISAVIENSLKERQLVIAGLINLAFVLLRANVGINSKHIAEVQWEIGTFILLKVMKKKREVSATIIQQLCNRIIIGSNVSHLTECLHQMCRNLTLTMQENQTVIIQLLEQILVIPGISAGHIINAIVPLIKVSPTIRDNLILILRKALYSKKIETRQMAAGAFIKLLKTLRISNLIGLSQSHSSTSNYSFLTQISLDCHAQQSAYKFSNEALCLEVLGILRRCFMQQSEVRKELYEGLYDAVCINPELGIPVLDMLWVHFGQFYNDDEGALPPLLFANVVAVRNTNVLLQEPLGKLIFVIGLIVIKLSETHDVSQPSVSRFTTILNCLCDRMSKCELIHFDQENNGDLLDTSLDSEKHLLILHESMSVYEALIGFLISSWKPDSENSAQKINSLFEGYSRLLDNLKGSNKVKKGDGPKKNTKRDTKPKNNSSRTKPYKPVASVLDFQTVGKLLCLLHEPTVSWANLSQTTVLKVNKDLHCYVLNVTLQLVNSVKSSKSIETTHTKPYFQYCAEIATVLFQQIVKRLTYVIDFDCNTAVLALECFHTVLSLVVSYYKEKIHNFFCIVGMKSKTTDLGDLVMECTEMYQNFFSKEEIEDCDNPESKKLSGVILNTYTLLVSILPNNSVHATKVLDWLRHYTDENVTSNKHTGHLFIVLLLNMHLRCKSASGLYENIALRINDVLGTVNQDKPECPVILKVINEGTALSALNSLCSTLKTMLSEVDWMVQRLRAEYRMIIFPGNEKAERRKEQLKLRERDLCCYLCQIINICSFISNTAVPAGANVEVILKTLIHLYNTLNLLTKYFLDTASKLNPNFQSARFERLVKLSGKPLTNKVYEFILYIEEGQQLNESTAGKRKASDPNVLKSRVLRETRLIPKLVYEMEQFGKNVITLSKKHTLDLSKYVGIGTSRDFRIKLPALKDALEKLNVSHNTDHNTDGTDEEVTDRENSVDEGVNNQNQPCSSSEVDDGRESATDVPPKKKAKRSK